METVAEALRVRAKKALANGEVDRIFAWKRGEFWYDATPAVFETAGETDELLWDSFCVANLSKYLVGAQKQGLTVGVFLKGCDALAFNQLLKDNRIARESVRVFGVPCPGMIDPAYTKTLATSRRAAAIIIPGRLLSQPAKVTMPSSISAFITVSTESAMTSRLTSE